MTTRDGSKKDTVTQKYVQCTRWEELCDTMRFQFFVSIDENIPSKFLFLNNKKIYETFQSTHQMLQEMLVMEGGGTPLCETINRVADDIELHKFELIQSRQKVVVFIATDGQSSDGDIRIPLSRLRDLPVHLILRLCTNDENIVNYWNQIDNDLELHLDVLDDFYSEAREIYRVNPEICYSECIHQYREFGTKTQEMDILDERKLSFDQLKNFARMIYGDDYIQHSNGINLNNPLYMPYCVVTGINRHYVKFTAILSLPIATPLAAGSGNDNHNSLIQNKKKSKSGGRCIIF